MIKFDLMVMKFNVKNKPQVLKRIFNSYIIDYDVTDLLILFWRHTWFVHHKTLELYSYNNMHIFIQMPQKIIIIDTFI